MIHAMGACAASSTSRREELQLASRSGRLLAITTATPSSKRGATRLSFEAAAADLPWIYLSSRRSGSVCRSSGKRGGRADSKLAVSVSLVVAAVVTSVLGGGGRRLLHRRAVRTVRVVGALRSWVMSVLELLAACTP